MVSSKELKESFVSGLTGTSIWEVYGVILTCCLGLVVRHLGLLCSRTIANVHRNSFTFLIFWEFVTVFAPTLLCFTVLADHYHLVFLCLLFLILAMFGFLFTRAKLLPLAVFANIPYPSKSPAISATRTWINIFTAVAILAVDFRIFPRRYAKVETYGTGVMDIGVGAFMIAHGMVSNEARGTALQSIDSARTYLKSIVQCVKKVLPYVVIGLFRTLSVKATDYQLHISEYGVHWNFFFTIAVVKFLSTLIAPLPKLFPSFLRYATFGMLLAFGYQFVLSRLGLMEYLVNGPGGDFSRNNFVSANREGLFSSIGFLALYYLGVEIGRSVHNVKKKTIGEVCKPFLLMFLSSIFCNVLTLALEGSVDRISRRVANVSYCFWIVTATEFVVLVMFATDLIVIYSMNMLKPTASLISPYYTESFIKNEEKDHSSLCHLDAVSAIDYNQFVFFFLANVSTGLVNFTIDTINTAPLASCFVLVIHVVGLMIVSISLKSLKIKLL